MTNNIDIPYFEDEKSKMNPDLPIIERNNINAVIINPKTNQVLCLDWEKFDWHTFIIGGVDEGEDIILAAKREIEEETGYKNLKFISEVGKCRSGYFAVHKNENRIANTTGLLFELMDEEKTETKESETANHVFKWIPKDDVMEYINLNSQKYIWEKTLSYLLPDLESNQN